MKKLIVLGLSLLVLGGYAGSVFAKRLAKKSRIQGCEDGVGAMLGPMSSFPEIQEKITEACTKYEEAK